MALLTKKDKEEMAERAEVRKKLNAEATREQIQTIQLVKVLQDHALGKGRAKMTAAKLKAIEILLDKSLPNLSAAKIDVEAKQVTFNMSTSFTPPSKPRE